MAPKQNWRPFFPTNRAFFCWYLITSAVFIFCAINKNRATILKKNAIFFTFCYDKYPPEIYIKKICFPQFRPICILQPIFGKKNRNKRLSVGLREIYSLYKIGDSFIAFLLIYFFSSNGSDQRFLS